MKFLTFLSEFLHALADGLGVFDNLAKIYRKHYPKEVASVVEQASVVGKTVDGVAEDVTDAMEKAAQAAATSAEVTPTESN